MRRKLLPFFDERKHKVEMIVLHAVALDAESAIDNFAQNKVASHYIVDENGEVWQLVAEKNRAWHAGVSAWRGKDDINSRSIGIEFCSKTLGQRPFTGAQKKTALTLLKKLIKKYKIRPENIVAHSDIAPTRKADPGKCFFWKELADAGIGLWPNLKNIFTAGENDVAKMLGDIGYDVSDLNAAAYAFCRRFLPKKVSDIEDVWQIEKNVCTVDEKLLKDDEFLQVLSAVVYEYRKASKTPCKM